MKAKRESGWRPGLWVLLLAALLARGAAADESVPRFFIETITVEAPRLSPEIVLSESLLREGEEYSEAELSEAVHRINRLPFVLRADFSLRKGSERDRYQLVVTVFETRRWFFQTDLGFAFNDPADQFRFDDRIGDRIREFDDEFDALVGRRFALGNRSLLFATFGSDDGTFAVGYQRYNLWDRNILFSISLGGEERFGSLPSSGFSLAGRAQLGIPVRGNHALRVLLGWREFDTGFGPGTEVDFEEKQAEVSWIFNSLDDSVMPREGSLFEAGLTWLDVDDQQSFFFGGVQEFVDFSDARLGVIAGASRHWPRANRQSLSAGVEGFFNEGSAGDERWGADVNVGHQVFLVRRLEPEEWRELRLETQLTGTRQKFLARTFFGSDFSDVAEDAWRARTGLVYRNRWGLFRLTFDYFDRELR